MLWLKQSWEWLKKNWKNVALLGIPVLVSFIVGILRSNSSLKNKVNTKDKEIDINNEVNELGESLRNDAWTNKEDALSSAHREHDLDMEDIRKRERAHLRLIETPEEATAAIKEKIK
tara:strand:- start:37 stop:387 length:351 start_codon:yes stop_codon:yes gene_type:complete